LNFFILTASFVVAVLGFVQSSQANPNDAVLFGLNSLGVGMIAVATLGFVAGLFKYYQDGKNARETQQREEETRNQIQLILAKVNGVQESTTDPELSDQIGKIAEGLSSVASLRRRSDFRMSDFSDSHFGQALFRGANFHGASFPHADLSGADLSEAITDEQTKLPIR
jgi:uncharacterized protein YjbI with pentapeptide repeats